MPLTVPLSAPDAIDPNVVGQKAARLAELMGAGFRVPGGRVIPVAGCEQWPTDADAQIAELLAELPGMTAVRSSAAAEDLATASFAGMYATILEVDGAQALREAIGEVIASARSERARAYHGSDPHMAVLVQRLVAAEQAGVAFTADPITGDRDVVVIHAVEGLGEALVSGEADPEEWEVRGEPSCRVGADVLTPAQATQVAELARRVEAHAGEPRDIEWAFAEGELWLLQARPITALPVAPELPEPEPGKTWVKERAHWAEPLSPFGFSTYMPSLEQGMATAFAEFGVLVEGLEAHFRGGEPYGEMIPVGGKSGPPPPAFLIGLLARVIPPLRKRMKAARDAIRAGKLESLPREWNETLRDRYQAEIDAMLAEDLGAMTDQELLEHIDRARDLLNRGQKTHFRLFIPYSVALAELAMGCRDMLGWEPVRALRLLTGLSNASSAPGAALRALAQRVRGCAKLRQCLQRMNDAGDLERIDADFAAAFRQFERRHGWRTTAYDPGAPTLAENPKLLARWILDELERDDTADDASTRAAAEQEARRALDGRADDLARFDALLAYARLCYPLREDNIALTDNFPCGVLRRVLLACGRRLVERGRLRTPDAARFLTVDELAHALLPESTDDLAPLTDRRLAEERWVRAHPGPDVLGPRPHDPPDTRWLPAEGRRINAAILWCMDQEMSPPEPSTGDEIRGRSGSPGVVKGRVKVIRGEADFHKLQAGEVLVCPITSPVWSVLFSNAAALVTDGGGAMSHAAVIAREYGIPAVLGTGDGTSRLSDGDWVEVDGNLASVRRIHAEPRAHHTSASAC